jgi:RNA polymerase sigma-70 factor (ECF subfamily)
VNVDRDVPDDALLTDIAAGDASAFTALFRRRHRDVYRVALLMTGRPATAEDVTQDVFLAVMRDAARFEPGRASAIAWLCGIARNHARRRLEHERRVVPLVEGDGPGAADPVVEPDPVGDIAAAQRVEALRRAILTLPLRYREVIVLCDLQELSYTDAASALDCAVGTVRSRLHRARALLTAKMRSTDSGGVGVPASPGLRQRKNGCLV